MNMGKKALLAIFQLALVQPDEDLRVTDDRVQGCPELVAHGREELAFLAGPVLGRVALAFSFLELLEHVIEGGVEVSYLVPGGRCAPDRCIAGSRGVTHRRGQLDNGVTDVSFQHERENDDPNQHEPE